MEMAEMDAQKAEIPLPPSPYIARDPEALARNVAKAVEHGSRALAAYLQPRDGANSAEAVADIAADAVKTLTKVGEYWASDPARLMEAQSRLFASYISAWQQSMGIPPDSDAIEASKRADKRFSDPDWNDNPIFSSLKQLYLATTQWAEQLVEQADLDERTRHKARFYIQQINNALAPTNFPLTNPEVLKETAQSNAENLVRGMMMLAEDIEAGKGQLKLRQTDPKHFKVGENIATTPGKVIYQNDICQIIQYQQTSDTVLKRPLLIVPPWINKFYVLDLSPEKSLIRWLVEKGHTVFVISWVNPDDRHAEKSFEDYMKEGILEALDVVEQATGERQVNAVGYCVGGTLLSMTLGYMALKGDDRIASATLLTTQVDFEFAGDLKVLFDADRIGGIEAEMARTGYLEGSKMANAFNMLRSNDLIWPYVVNNYMKGKEPFPFDLLFWNADATRMPKANHSFYLRSCYLDNQLSKGEIVIGGEKIDLKKVTIPIYNLATREDHIAPAKSVFRSSLCFGGPVRLVVSGSGHIAGVVNPPSRKKYQYWVGGAPKGTLEEWMEKAEEHPGSWWDDWHAWIEEQDGTRISEQREPGGSKLTPIEDAPGSYVMVRA
jgi:polyhydroxyalkanoate synthase subunit PhaC